MSRRMGLSAALSVVCIYASCMSAGTLYEDPLFGYTKTSDVVYGIGNTNLGPMQLLMDVYQPTDIGLGPVQTNRPAVVIQDGGAWTSGDKENGRVVTPAIYLAQRGYTVFIADYRQVADSPISGPGPWQNLRFSSNGSLAGAAVSIYPSQNVIRAGIEDFATALTYVRSNAAAFGIDPHRLGAAGGSAGGINLLDLQYNGTPDAAYRADAVVALVSTMYGDWDKVVPGGPPLFMFNNALDPLIWYNSDVEPNLHNKLLQSGIYFEQWMEEPNLTDHNVHYEQHPPADPNNPYMTQWIGDTSKDVLQRMADFLENHLAGGPVTISDQSLTSASTDNGRFLQFDYNGNPTTVAQKPGLSTPLDVAHDASNQRYVVDALASQIIKYDASGNKTIFADQSKGLILPTSIAISGDGSIYAANYLSHQILKFDASGNGVVFSSGAKGLLSPFGLAVDGSGRVFVAEVDAKRIMMLDSSGNATVFADASSGLLTPVALAFDSAGNLYVVDSLASTIYKFDAQGHKTVFADGSDGLLLPTGIAIDLDGSVFASNYISDQIIKISPAGIASLFANSADGIDGPFGLDLYRANAAFAALAPQLGLDVASVPEAGSLTLVGVAAVVGSCVTLRRRSRASR